MEQVAGGHHLLLGQVGDHVAAGVAAAQEEEDDVALLPVEYERAVEGEVGQGQLQGAQLGGVGVEVRDLGLELGPLRRVPALRDPLPSFHHVAGDLRDLFLDPRQPEMGQVLPGRFRGDDRHLLREGHGVGVVALGVVPVEVGVEHVAHRLARELADLGHERPRRGRPGVGVHHQHSILVGDDRRVAVDGRARPRDRRVDSLRGWRSKRGPSAAGAAGLARRARPRAARAPVRVVRHFILRPPSFIDPPSYPPPRRGRDRHCMSGSACS